MRIKNPALIMMLGVFSDPTKVSIVLEELKGEREGEREMKMKMNEHHGGSIVGRAIFFFLMQFSIVCVTHVM